MQYLCVNVTRENCIQTLVPSNKSYNSLTFPGMMPQAKRKWPRKGVGGGGKNGRKKKKKLCFHDSLYLLLYLKLLVLSQ